MRRIAVPLLTTLACLTGPGAGQEPPKPTDDPQARASLRKMGVTLVYDEDDPHRRVVSAVISGTAVKDIDGALSLLAKLPQLRELTLSGATLIASDLKQFKSLKEIQTLHLISTVVRRKDLQALDGLKELKSLDLTNSLLEGPEWAHNIRYWAPEKQVRAQLRELKLGGEAREPSYQFSVSGMENLERLEDYGGLVEGVEIGELKQLKHLVLKERLGHVGFEGWEKLENLESLTLIGMSGEVAGLAKLKNLKKLKSLNISFSRPAAKEVWTKLNDLTQIEDLTLGLKEEGPRIEVDKLINLRRLSIDAGPKVITLGELPSSVVELRIISGIAPSSLWGLRTKMPKLRVSGKLATYDDARATLEYSR